jgi:hypothetical protein
MPELRRHETARECLLAFMGPAMAEAGDPDPASWVLGGITEGGEVEGVSFEQAVATVERSGLWGFSDVPNRTIHYWVAPGCGPGIPVVTLKLALSFAAHELAHLSEIRLDPAADGLRDEIQAEMAAEIAVAAYEIACKIISAQLPEPGTELPIDEDEEPEP